MVKCKKCITGRKEGDEIQSLRYKLNDLKLKINVIKNNDDLSEDEINNELEIIGIELRSFLNAAKKVTREISDLLDKTVQLRWSHIY